MTLKLKFSKVHNIITVVYIAPAKHHLFKTDRCASDNNFFTRKNDLK